MSVIALWAHSRSASTAFLRMMIERGDLTVVHEPFLALHEEGSVTLPNGKVARSPEELVTGLLDAEGQVFVKEVVDYDYDYPPQISEVTHTFLVRDPRPTIASHYAAKATVTCPEIGYERLYGLFELAWKASGRRPLVMRTEDLLADPSGAVEAYCAYTGLPFVAEALSWQPQDRPEWHRHRAWHQDAAASAGFHEPANSYTATVDTNPVLRSFYDHHLPFYEQIAKYAMQTGSSHDQPHPR
jgi:hypothetical protein